MLEAVIGLGPHLFYGTGIPACILVLRPARSKAGGAQGQGAVHQRRPRVPRRPRAELPRARAHREDRHRLSTRSTTCRLRPRRQSQELRENDDNLNIRRYADNTPPPEPHDVRAHLHGGIPAVEIAAKAAASLLTVSIPTASSFPRTPTTSSLLTWSSARSDLRRLIESDAGFVAAECAVIDAIGLWWKERGAALRQTAVDQADLVDLRRDFIETFHGTLATTPLLDPFVIRGIVASWWGVSLPDLKALATHGYRGLIEAWVSTVLDALAEEKAKVNPLDHKVARALLPEYLDKLAGLEGEVAELESTIKAATAPEDEEDGDEPAEEALSTAELKKLKSKLAATKKQLKAEKAAFAERLAAASAGLDETSGRQIVLDALERDLLAEANDRIARTDEP